MPHSLENTEQRQQNTFSALLIAVNMVLSFIVVLCIPQHEDDFFMGIFYAMLLAVLLQALFVFTYKGKAPVPARWILGLLVAVAILYGVFIAYIAALGSAFQH